MQKLHLKIPYRYREIVKKPKRFHSVMRWLCLLKVKIHPT